MMTILIAQDAGFGRQISYRKLGKGWVTHVGNEVHGY